MNSSEFHIGLSAATAIFSIAAAWGTVRAGIARHSDELIEAARDRASLTARINAIETQVAVHQARLVNIAEDVDEVKRDVKEILRLMRPQG